MNRAVRRQTAAQQAKAGRAARSPIRPLPRRGPARGSDRSERRSTLAAIAGWRPRFIMDIINELRKVVWPTRQDTTYLTVVVIVVTIIMGAVLGGIDIGFGWLIDNVLLR